MSPKTSSGPRQKSARPKEPRGQVRCLCDVTSAGAPAAPIFATGRCRDVGRGDEAMYGAQTRRAQPAQSRRAS